MLVETTISRGDVFRASFRILTREKRYCVFVVAPLAVFLLLQFGTWRPWVRQALQVLLAACVFFIFFVTAVVLIVGPYFAETRRNGALGPCVYRIADDGLMRLTPNGTSVYYWPSILEIWRGRTAIQVHLNTSDFVLIPKRAFATPADYEAYWQTLTDAYLAGRVPAA
jgi:YcxB-like protein